MSLFWYLMLALYLAGGLATSLYAAVRLVRSGPTYVSLSSLDGEDWTALAVASVLWPLAWLVALWVLAATSLLRADVHRQLKGLGATYEEKGTTDD